MSARRSSKPQQSRREEIWNLLRERGTATEITEIADSLDLHPNTVRFHLDVLVGAGRVERTVADDARPGRPPQLFTAVRAMDPAGPRNYRLLAEILLTSLAAAPRPRQRAVEAGLRWGRQQAAAAVPLADQASEGGRAAAVGGLVHLLEELGFAPELSDDGETPVRVGLRHCPFLDITESRRDIVCPLHLGLMRGTLESWGSDVTVDRLDAFVQPDLCMAHLAYPDAS